MLVGLLLTLGFRNYAHLGSNAAAGFILGLFLFILGIAGLLTAGRQTITIDPRARKISIEDVTRLGTKTRDIAFADIVSIGIGYLGKKSNHLDCYYLALRLKDGKTYSLFAPGRFYEGSSERAVVEGWQQRLADYMAGAA